MLKDRINNGKIKLKIFQKIKWIKIMNLNNRKL